MQTIEKLFSQPLPSTRSGAFNNTFPYPTRISPEAIAVYIACVTKPGDTVLDAFAGSGSTGIAALLCEHPTEQMKMLAKGFGVEPTWGKRNAVLYEIGTYASFATRTLLNRVSASEYKKSVDSFVAKAEEIIGSAYTVIDPNGQLGVIRHVIWSDILICPACNSEISYFEYGTTRNPVSFINQITCPHCGKRHRAADMPFATEEHFDRVLEVKIERKKRVPAWIYGTTNGKNWDRAANDADIKEYRKLEETINVSSKPKKITWGELHRAGYHFGVNYLHQFYTTRNYAVMLRLWNLTETYPPSIADALKLLLLSYNATHCTLMTRVVAKKNSKDFVLTGAQSGVLYISKIPVEKNILLGLKRKSKPFYDAYSQLEKCTGSVVIHNASSADITENDNSIDFVFTDPPFGDYIPYAEVNQINELWLQNQTNRVDEVIISASQNKGVSEYQAMLSQVFCEIQRVLKDEGYAAVVFHAAKAKVWEAFNKAVTNASMQVAFSSILDKRQASFKQIVSDGSVQGDPLFLIQKKNTGAYKVTTSAQVLDNVIRDNISNNNFDARRCYSVYIGKCIEYGITEAMDAKDVYEYYRLRKEAENNDKTTT